MHTKKTSSTEMLMASSSPTPPPRPSCYPSLSQSRPPLTPHLLVLLSPVHLCSIRTAFSLLDSSVNSLEKDTFSSSKSVCELLKRPFDWTDALLTTSALFLHTFCDITTGKKTLLGFEFCNKINLTL